MSENRVEHNQAMNPESVLVFLASLKPEALVTYLVGAMKSLDPCGDDYYHLVAELLNRLTPGKMNTELNNSLMRIANLSAFEGVWLREKRGKKKLSGRNVEVFLKQRAATEAHGSQFHCSGTVMRASENTVSDVLRRLAINDFGGKIFLRADFTGIFYPVQDERGTLLSHIYLVEPWDKELDPKYGQWFDVEALPENMVPHHRQIIADAMRVKYPV